MEVGVPAVRIYAEYEVTFLSLENISCIFVANIFFPIQSNLSLRTLRNTGTSMLWSVYLNCRFQQNQNSYNSSI